jgi:octaprenyl-diphosphate synthase
MQYNLAQIKHLLADDLSAFNRTIADSFSSDLELLKNVAKHIFTNQGKQLRPIIVMLIAKASNYKGKQHINVGIIIEALHLAMLLHDDVVDNSQMRRGAASVNYKWNNATGVLVGDFIYSRSFEMIAQLNNPQILSILANATNYIAQGEIMQLSKRDNLEITQIEYNEIIRRKTAKLFEVAVTASLALCEQDVLVIDKVGQYGLELGMAFQIIDDMLDYTGDSANLGKQIGDDLTQGNITLPIIYALEVGNPQQQTELRAVLKNRGSTGVQNVLEIINATGAIDYARKCSDKHIKAAKNCLADLPTSEYKDALESLADIVITREV